MCNHGREEGKERDLRADRKVEEARAKIKAKTLLNPVALDAIVEALYRLVKRGE